MAKVIEMQRSGAGWASVDEAHGSVPALPWGLYDTVDQCWMGDTDGPKIFRDGTEDIVNLYAIARIAAQVLNTRLGQDPGRTRVRTYGGGADKLRETVEAKMSTEAALSGLEDGRFI